MANLQEQREMERALHAGLNFLQNGEKVRALEILIRLQDQDHPLAHYFVATFKMKTANGNPIPNLTDAVTHYERAIEQKPDFADAYLMLARAQRQIAAAEIEEVGVNPKGNDRHRSLLYSAEDNLTHASRLNPSFSEAVRHEKRMISGIQEFLE
ncbi:MAG: hypothetical protein ABII01_07285 [Candidatus Woesearchaeota archaeon]